MSTQFFKIKPFLICVVVGILIGLVSKYIFQSSHAVTVFSGLVAFCISIVLYIYFKQVLILKRVELLHHGILSYEKQINERLHDLTNNLPEKQDSDPLKQDLQPTQDQAQTPKVSPSLDPSSQLDDEIASYEDNKVVKLHPEKTQAPTSNKLLSRLDLSDEAAVNEKLINGLKIQLQTSISLGTKQIYSFDALPCLTDDESYHLNNHELKSTFNNENQQRIINQTTLDQTIILVRKLRRDKISPLVFVEVLSSTLNDKEAYDEFISALKAHHQVKKNIIIEIPQFDFLTLSKAGIAKLRLILDLGYTLSMSNCTDVAEAISAIKIGLFSHIKLAIDTFEALTENEKKSKELEIVSLCRDSNINIIASGVEKDFQVIQLIDYHVAIAQGSFFSEPKFPNQSDIEKTAVVTNKNI